MKREREEEEINKKVKKEQIRARKERN